MPNPRVPFLLADERPRLAPPDGKPMIVHVFVNVETWPFDQPMPRKLLTGPHGADPVPDIPNFSWVEYGLRVGMPRLFALFAERRVPVSAFINAGVCDDYPRLAERVGEARWEIVGHGYRQRSLQSEGAAEHEVIEKSLDRLTRFYGVRPRGWLGPGLKETFDTPDHLKAAGIDYVCDWVIDDLPDWMETRHGRLICMPYTLELNDATLYAVQQHPSDAMYRRMQDSLTCFSPELVRQPRILTLALHPHLIAVPHRMVYLERMINELQSRSDTIFMTGAGIADWFVAADSSARGK
jgi:peptidoglycan/xylan/chitin deacetylase (PgdA/CDA1 family)